jgi:hypothetical protein
LHPQSGCLLEKPFSVEERIYAAIDQGGVGIVPSTYDSGESEKHGHITKSGSPSVRGVLCEAAHHAARPTHPLHPYWVRLFRKGGYKKAVIGVTNRMSRILFQMWRNGEEFTINKLNIVNERVEVKKTVYYRLKTA